MTFSLEGSTALVTGGGIRLGRAIAEGLAAIGAKVAVHHHRSAQGAKAAVEGIVSRGGRAMAFGADLTAPGAPGKLVAQVERELGKIDVLVNSAAVFERAAFMETDEGLLDRQWRLNARAPYLLTQAAAKGMLARGSGAVVNVLDLGGALVPWREYSAYCMAKAALGMLTQCLALELAPAIRVNGVAPGTVLPPASLSAEQREVLRRRIPLQRFGSPEDVVQTVQFLVAGPTFVTGQILAVDGGRMRSLSEPAIRIAPQGD